ncbi:MAG: hypothetical protein E6R08_06500 [Nevskiaceae bacterium]|nr:MAG: hypothetical protein E6R08_06500 [Nevskiaceae bacterium]
MTKVIGYAVTKLFAETVEVITVNGGWTKYRNIEGNTAKIRNGQLREATEAEIKAFKSINHKNVPAAEPAKEPKAANPPKKDRPGQAVDLQASADGENSAKPTGLVNPDYAKYKKHDVKSPSGRRALDIDDKAAEALRGQDISDCYFIVAKHLAAVDGETRTTDVIEAELIAKYQKLNVGMQRMNLGNRLRKAMGIYGNLNAHKTKKPVAE